MLGENKGINLPGIPVKVPSLTEKDEEDLIFAVGEGIDAVAVSFVRTADDVRHVRRRLDALHSDCWIIAKLEKPQAVEHLDSILEVADAIMVARGDLGVEVPPEKVPAIQKHIIRRAAEYRKPVITATQMLESMIENPRPTRAEASDVANAIYDGTDAVMLSGETAAGKYPVQTVAMMAKIVAETEHQIRLDPPPQIVNTTADHSGSPWPRRSASAWRTRRLDLESVCNCDLHWRRVRRRGCSRSITRMPPIFAAFSVPERWCNRADAAVGDISDSVRSRFKRHRQTGGTWPRRFWRANGYVHQQARL